MKFNGRPCTVFVLLRDQEAYGARIGQQTIARLMGAVALVKEGYNITSVVVTPGISPDKISHPRQTETFANMAKDWLLKEGHFKGIPILTGKNPKAWTTMGEMDEARKIIGENGLSNNVVVVSGHFHILRVWITWGLLEPDGWNSEFVSVWDGYTGVFHEVLGIPYYVLRAFIKR